MTSKRSPSELQNSMTIAQLRQLAASYNLPVKRDMNAASLAALISAHESGPSEVLPVTSQSSDRPLPGWARIEIHKDASPHASNADVFAGVNGYTVLIKRGVKVDVPIKILRGSLMDAKSEVLRENPNEGDPDKRYSFEEVYQYPFTVYDINEGPDPRDTYEKAVKRKMQPRVRFRDKNGYWPKPAELREWLMKQGD